MGRNDRDAALNIEIFAAVFVLFLSYFSLLH